PAPTRWTRWALRGRRRLRPREAATGGRRGRLVQPYLGARGGQERLLLGDVLARLLRRRLLHLSDSLRRHVVCVLLLDPGQPPDTLGGLLVVHVALSPEPDRLIDLLEQGVHQLGLRDLPEWLAVREDQALVLRPGDPEVRVRGLADAVHRAPE